MNQKSSCVLLADRHHGLRDSVRGLLETEFETVFMVADEASLLEGAGRLRPGMVVVDLSLSSGDMRGLLARVGERAPGSKILVLPVHDQSTVADAALAAGADGVVLNAQAAGGAMVPVVRRGRAKEARARTVAPLRYIHVAECTAPRLARSSTLLGTRSAVRTGATKQRCSVF
jgi:DNA-binding NarL/FixJ family response regulator